MKKFVLLAIAAAVVTSGCTRTDSQTQTNNVGVIDHIVAGEGGPGHEWDADDSGVYIYASYIKFNDLNTGKYVYVGGNYTILQK